MEVYFEFLKRFDVFSRPELRTYWPVLLFSLSIASLFGVKLKDYWHKESLTDLKWFCLNNFLKALILPLFSGATMGLALWGLNLAHIWLPETSPLQEERGIFLLGITLVMFVLDDLLKFLQHKLFHTRFLFKKFHWVHHSSQHLTPLTLFRNDPVFSLMSSFRRIAFQAFVIFALTWGFKTPLQLVELLGVNVFGLLFNVSFANLRHSTVPISFGILEYLFISPRMHQAHHGMHGGSHHCNLGVALSVWDQLNQTFFRPETQMSFKWSLKTDPQKSYSISRSHLT